MPATASSPDSFKVMVDATPIRGKLSGVGVYTDRLIDALSKLQDKENFNLGIYFQPSLKNWLLRNFSKPEGLRNYDNISCLPIPVTISHFLAKYPNSILSQYEPLLASPDIIQGTDHFVYPCQNSRKIMTIHDLTFMKYPHYATAIVKTYSERIKKCLQWTDLIVTFSENSKKDIVELLNFNPQQIWVTPQASRYPSDYLSSRSIENLKKNANYDFSKPYILFVSTLEPRKNIESLISAFNALKSNEKIEHQLVLIGQKGWKYRPILEAIEKSPWRNCIHHLNYLSDELVALFYSQADAFVYPSHYEGFGLPVLEAMALGAPVITAKTSSLPEVTGNAAILIDPENSTQLAGAILNVIADSELRQELRRRGRERAKLFSWEKTARETLAAYRSLL